MTKMVMFLIIKVFQLGLKMRLLNLQDIWQNLPPDIGQEMEVQEIAITHPLLKKELLGNGSAKGNTPIPLPERLRWMVFKVKQRAANNYFEKTVLRNSKINQSPGRGNVTQDEFGLPANFQFNWPYDFFSLVEMVKIDSEVVSRFCITVAPVVVRPAIDSKCESGSDNAVDPK